MAVDPTPTSAIRVRFHGPALLHERAAWALEALLARARVRAWELVDAHGGHDADLEHTLDPNEWQFTWDVEPSGERDPLACAFWWLARVEEPIPEGADGMPGVIIPRKTVAELRKLLDEEAGDVEVALSDTRIQFKAGAITLTSKLIDGTFPEYERVIPKDNDKVLRVGKKDFADAVARVAAISSERSRPVKMALSPDLLTLSAASPEQGTASEELDGGRVSYTSGPLEIGFQARYLNDITDQISENVEFHFSDGSAPTVVRDASDASALYVLMPMRV